MKTLLGEPGDGMVGIDPSYSVYCPDALPSCHLAGMFLWPFKVFLKSAYVTHGSDASQVTDDPHPGGATNLVFLENLIIKLILTALFTSF